MAHALGTRFHGAANFPSPYSIIRNTLETLASIWGFFISMRFPCHDWYLLPALETVYYGIGAWLEA
jgi:methylene-fatty-acyl-phospholipid synthase